ncbi:MAG: transposase [Bacteroidetes bacterium]|nr:transposase [Bacteroidota bacterium]
MRCGTDISDLYRTRWQIELLFKSWKTGIKIESIIPNDQINTIRIEAVLYMILLILHGLRFTFTYQLRLRPIKNIKK